MKAKKKALRVALVGNPNSGKTTLFNAITGSHHKVGNYAGVTVDIKHGQVTIGGQQIVIYDLPGIYSLTAYSQDEIIARDFILNEQPDVIINVLDATNIERNLYLCLQLQELGIPMVGALNIYDQAESMGIKIDIALLSALLRMPLQKTIGSKKKGIDGLLNSVLRLTAEQQLENVIRYGQELELEINQIETMIRQQTVLAEAIPPRWLAIKLLEKDSDAAAKLRRSPAAAEIFTEIDRHIGHIESHFGKDAEIIISEQRYASVTGMVREAVVLAANDKPTMTQKIDNVLLNRFLGLPIFLVALWAVFQVTFTVGAYPMDWLNTLFGNLSNYLSDKIAEGIWHSLVIDGIIGGVGSVLSFVPLIILLFVLISFLEDTGYMSRAAFIMDRFLHIFGLHGQSFLPMIIGFGCSVPAVMATRTLRSPKDRILSTLILPFMSCGAKLPVYTLLAAAFFREHAGNVVMSIYLLGVVLALGSSIILKKLVFKGLSTPFVMELPPYRIPTIKGILWHVWDKTCHYFRKAATVILGASLIVWLLTTFPHSELSEAQKLKAEQQFIAANPQADQQVIEQYVAQAGNEARLAGSAAGKIGQTIEPIIAPLGFNWKIGVAVITGVSAKEVVVSTLGVLYRVGTPTDDNSDLQTAMRDDPSFTPLTAYVLMLFTLISFPCLAALSAIKAEIGTRWLLFSMAYNLLLAWSLCFIAYQVGSRVF